MGMWMSKAYEAELMTDAVNDLNEIERSGCLVIHSHDICDDDLYDLFAGEQIPLSTGNMI